MLYSYSYNINFVGTADNATEKFGLRGDTLGVILGTLSSALVFIGTAVMLCAIIGGVLLVKRKGMPVNIKILC